MIAACAVQIPIKNIPAHVVIIRDGEELQNPSPGTTPVGATPPPSQPQSLFLQVGDQISVSRPGRLTFGYDGNRYRIVHGSVTLKCASVRIGRTAKSPATGVLAVDLKWAR